MGAMQEVEIQRIMRIILHRDDIMKQMADIMDKEVEVFRLDSFIGLLGRGVTHRIPVGVISSPKIDMKKIVNGFINDLKYTPNTPLAQSEVDRMYTKKIEYMGLRGNKMNEIESLKNKLKNILEPRSYVEVKGFMDNMGEQLRKLYKGVYNRSFENGDLRWSTNKSLMFGWQHFYKKMEADETLVVMKKVVSDPDESVMVQGDRNNGHNEKNGRNKEENAGKEPELQKEQGKEPEPQKEEENVGYGEVSGLKNHDKKWKENGKDNNNGTEDGKGTGNTNRNKLTNYFDSVSKEEALKNNRKEFDKIKSIKKAKKSTEITKFFKKLQEVNIKKRQVDELEDGLENKQNDDSGLGSEIGDMGQKVDIEREDSTVQGEDSMVQDEDMEQVERNGDIELEKTGDIELNKAVEKSSSMNSGELKTYFRAADGTVYNYIQSKPLNLSMLKRV